jgi:hypothetical protein
LILDVEYPQNVACGSNSEVELAGADFRFTPESRHPAGGLGCPFCAISRLMQRSKEGALFDHLVGPRKKRGRDIKPKRFRSL